MATVVEQKVVSKALAVLRDTSPELGLPASFDASDFDVYGTVALEYPGTDRSPDYVRAHPSFHRERRFDLVSFRLDEEEGEDGEEDAWRPLFARMLWILALRGGGGDVTHVLVVARAFSRGSDGSGAYAAAPHAGRSFALTGPPDAVPRMFEAAELNAPARLLPYFKSALPRDARVVHRGQYLIPLD